MKGNKKITEGQYDSSQRGTEVVSGTGLVTFVVGEDTFNVANVKGIIVDNTGEYFIRYDAESDIEITSTIDGSIYVYIDKSNSLQQQTTTPTRGEFRSKLFLTRLAIQSGGIVGQEQIANPSGQYSNTIRDFLSYIPSPKKGLELSANANLTFKTAFGSIFELGINNANEANNTNEIEFTSLDPINFFYLNRNSTISTSETNINVTQYDNNGTQTTMTNNRFKILTVYRFNSGNTVVQDGQAEYLTLDEAQVAITTRVFIVNPVSANGTRLGWIIVQKSATDLTDVNEARIINDKGTISTGTASSGALLANNNLSDLLDAETARTNLDVYAKDEVVDLTSEQTIGGEKTLTSNMLLEKVSPSLIFFDTIESEVGSIVFTGFGFEISTSINSPTIRSNDFKINEFNTPPASSTSAGSLGDIRYTTDYIYICTATDTWKRVAISTW